VTIAEAAYETLHGEGWIGVCASKTVKAGPGSVRVLDLVATSGSLSLEMLYSGEETTPGKLAELAGRLLAAARVAKPAPDPGTAPVSPPPSDGSPREAFETMVRAVRGKDLGLYKSCFTEEALKGEAGLELFEKDPEKFWAELGATFKGPQTLTLEGPLPEEGRVKGKVEAPEADRGGIGTLTFLKEGGRWKIHRW
ncbi:MAG: hypothetical protein MUC63_06835, partial [Planctomycetes bacterium]|jgi:hypothetical protein|nr:hypothetical protein [Planctomycetota bacterium]